MAEAVRSFFARGNTASGARYLYESAFQGLEKIILLQGMQGTGKSTILSRLADDMKAKGYSVELFHSPFNPKDLDALIVKELGVGVADGRQCEGVASVEGARIVGIDFDQAVAAGQLTEETQAELARLDAEFKAALSKAYDTFAEALRVHDELEYYYINEMDFDKGNQIAQELAASFFKGKTAGGSGKATVRHLFFGAATPVGAVDFIMKITDGLDRRIYIKGRPGSGKSTMLKTLARSSEQHGVDVEVYHCGFDPNSLDMLVFPELSLAIFDSTAPHEYFPCRETDEILDMYELAITPGTDEKYERELTEITKRYKDKMKEATSYLADAQAFNAQIQEIRATSVDFSVVDRLYGELLDELNKTALNVGE